VSEEELKAELERLRTKTPPSKRGASSGIRLKVSGRHSRVHCCERRAIEREGLTARISRGDELMGRLVLKSHISRSGGPAMSRFAWIVTFTALAAAPSAAQTAIPDVRGIWKGESESIVLGSAHPHHPATQPNEPQFRSVAFTLTIDKQDGRRFSGIFSSARSSEKVIAVISRAVQSCWPTMKAIPTG
jgi:hypothetical protein